MRGPETWERKEEVEECPLLNEILPYSLPGYLRVAMRTDIVRELGHAAGLAIGDV